MDSGILAALTHLQTEPDHAEALAQLTAWGDRLGKGKADEGRDDVVLVNDKRALEAARSLHKERGNFDLFVTLSELSLQLEKDSAARAALLIEEGRVLNEELLDDKRALAVYERAQKEKAGKEVAEAAEEALSHMALVRDNWKKIVKKYLDEAKDATDRQLATSLYLSAAESYARYDNGKDSAERVEQYLKKALELDPKNGKAA